jgi:tetratricopeptide (TPR) repeat protein
MGKLDAARAGFERALLLAERFGDTLMMARCANNIGNVTYYRGDLAEALRQYGHAASLFDQVGSVRGVAEAWHNTGVVRREEGDFEAAGEAADRAIEAAERLGDLRILGWTLGGRGETDALQGDLRLGRARTARALELAREQEDRLTEIDCTRVLSRIALAEGKPDESLDLARGAVRLAGEIGNPWMLARSQQQLATALAARRSRQQAVDAYTAAAAAFEWSGADGRAEAMRLLASRLS